MSCGMRECTDGITACDECNGFGWLTMGGKRYKKRSGARNIGLSTTKKVHELCAGTGMRVCGCTPLDDRTVAVVTGRELVGSNG